MKRLRELREMRNFSPEDLALKLNISEDLLMSYENGETLPTSYILIKLADTLFASVDYILERTEIKNVLNFSDIGEKETEIIKALRKQSVDNRLFLHRMITGLE